MVYVIQVCWQLACLQAVIQVCWQLATKLSANLYDIYHCCVYSEKLLMMDRGTVWNIWNFIPKINWEISASGWFHCKNWCDIYIYICLEMSECESFHPRTLNLTLICAWCNGETLVLIGYSWCHSHNTLHGRGWCSVL